MGDGYLGYANGTAYSPLADRLLDGIMATPAPGGLWARPGLRGDGLAVTVGGSNPEVVTITAGGGIILDTGTNAGSYRFHTGQTRTKNLAGRPGAGTSRYDEVVARLTGTATDDVREVELAIIQGDAAASPTPPAIPNGAVRINRLLVPASGSVTVQARGQRTVALGGILPVASAVEEAAVSPVWEGLTLYREDAGMYRERRNGAWRWRDTEWRNSTNITAAGGSPASGAGSPIDFPAWLKTVLDGAIPTVQVTVIGQTAGTYVAGAQDVTSTTFRVGVRRLDGSNLAAGQVIPVDFVVGPKN